MGEVIRFTNHKLSKCDDSCNGCFVCEGGLALCTVCGGAESSLSTHCPGEKMSAQTANFVSSGVIDYKNGHWRDAVTGMKIVRA